MKNSVSPLRVLSAARPPPPPGGLRTYLRWIDGCLNFKAPPSLYGRPPPTKAREVRYIIPPHFLLLHPTILPGSSSPTTFIVSLFLMFFFFLFCFALYLFYLRAVCLPALSATATCEISMLLYFPTSYTRNPTVRKLTHHKENEPAIAPDGTDVR